MHEREKITLFYTSIQEAKRGDFLAIFESIVLTHSSFVLRCVRHLGGREADALDLAQEVFLIAYEKRAQLTRPEGVRSWLYRICFGVVRNHQRKAHVRREVTGVDVVEGCVADPTEVQHRRETLARVLAAIQEPARAVLVAHVIEGIPMKDVAQTLDIPLKTAYSRLYAARRAALAAYEGRS